MIFRNPAGAPELACDECGCRWFDRMSGTCYECGVTVTAEMRAEFCGSSTRSLHVVRR